MTDRPLRFEELIERYHDEIYGYLWRLCDNGSQGDVEAAAEDLTQETYLRAYQAFARLRPHSNVRAWLYKIATRCAYTALQRRQLAARRYAASLDEATAIPASTTESPPALAMRNEMMAAVRRAVAALPPKQQAAFILRHVQGMAYAELAQALACSEESARANVSQAVRRLRRELGDARMFEYMEEDR